MATVNRIILIGALTALPDIKVTGEGVPFAKFNLGVDRFETPDSSAKQRDFFDIIAWRNQAEKLNGMQKGDLLLVEGRILVNTYESDNGQRRWATEIDAKDVRLISRVNSISNAEQPTKPKASKTGKSSSLEVKSAANIDSVDFDFGSELKNELASPPDFSLELEEEVPY